MKILAGVDLAETTDKVVAQTGQLAMGMQAQVWLVHVAEPEPDFVGYKAGPQHERDFMAQTFHREHVELQAIADRLRASGLDVTALLVQGATAETLLKEAAKLGADMIVVGSHRRGAVGRLLLGSASEGVLHGAGCPVLIVPGHCASRGL